MNDRTIYAIQITGLLLAPVVLASLVAAVVMVPVVGPLSLVVVTIVAKKWWV